MADISPALSIAERVDAVCDQFEGEFRADLQPRLENYLSAVTESLRIPLFRALLELELELRQNQGPPPQIADYEARFPDQLEQIGKAFEAASQPPSMISSVKLTGIETSQGPIAGKLAALKPSDSHRLERLGRFEIHSVLGEGAFGTVYRARDPQLDREVAVKVPHFSSQQTLEDRQRFLREARTAAGLHHPCICPVHEVGSVDGHDYIVLAYIDGQPLSKILQTKPQLSSRQIVTVICKIAMTLQEAHDKGIVHRDLKPANIMINRKGEPVIMDFGLARRSDSSDAQISQHGQILGTPAYMSPEQARGNGKSVGPTSDVYSLGIVLYELLCGRRPFEGTLAEVIGQILHVAPPPPAQFRPEVDLRLQAICLKSIAKNHADRYASMQEFASALMDYFKTIPAPERTAAGTQAETNTVNDHHTTQFAHLVAAITSEVQLEVERPIRRTGRPSHLTWWAYLAVAGLTGVVILLGIFFFIRKDMYTVIVNIPIENINDPALSFLLDDNPIGVAVLAAPIELKTGDHELIVQKDGKLFKQFRFQVGKENNERVDVQDVTLAPAKPVEPPSVLKPSPLDVLNAADIPEAKLNELYEGRAHAPPMLVAILPNLGTDPRDQYKSLELSPDGKILASGQYPWNMIELRNLASRSKFSELATEPKDGWPYFIWLKFSSDGQTLYGLRNGEDLYAYNIRGKELWRAKARGNYCLPAVSPDDSTIVVADVDMQTNMIHVLDARTGIERTKWPDILAAPICRFQYSPDGKTLAVMSGSILKLVDPIDGSIRKTISLRTAPEKPIFCRDGKKVFHSHHWREPEDYISETDLATEQTREYRLPPNGCRDVVVNPVFPILATSDVHKNLHFWDTEAGLKQTPHIVNLGSIAEEYQFTPEGRYLVVGCNPGVFVFRLPADRKVSEWGNQSNGAEVAKVKTETEVAKAKAAAEIAKAKAESEVAKAAPVPAIAPFDTAQAQAHQEAWAKHLGVPVEYPNSIGMKFRLIPPGIFTMGTPADEIAALLRSTRPDDRPAGDLLSVDALASEGPQHLVELTHAIYLGVFEVTQGQYKSVMGTNPSAFAETGSDPQFVRRIKGVDTSTFPVDGVSWLDTAEFCAKLSTSEQLKPHYFVAQNDVTMLNGTGYRLPTEAVWEFACRAGTTKKYWNGDDAREVQKIAWLFGNAGGRTHAVGELPANPFGLHDVYGNLWEWVEDGWDPKAYQQFADHPAVDPLTPAAPGARRVIRGGIWSYGPGEARSSKRMAGPPTLRWHQPGFRVSLPVDAVKQALSRERRP